jgi:hypothetical protein
VHECDPGDIERVLCAVRALWRAHRDTAWQEPRRLVVCPSHDSSQNRDLLAIIPPRPAREQPLVLESNCRRADLAGRDGLGPAWTTALLHSPARSSAAAPGLCVAHLARAHNDRGDRVRGPVSLDAIARLHAVRPFTAPPRTTRDALSGGGPRLPRARGSERLGR